MGVIDYVYAKNWVDLAFLASISRSSSHAEFWSNSLRIKRETVRKICYKPAKMLQNMTRQLSIRKNDWQKFCPEMGSNLGTRLTQFKPLLLTQGVANSNDIGIRG